MTWTRRNFILTAGSALAGAVFVPKYERWFGVLKPTLPDVVQYTESYMMGFRVSKEMLDDDIYGIAQMLTKGMAMRFEHHTDSALFTPIYK